MPFLGSTNVEKHIPLHTVIDIIMEQGTCENSIFMLILLYCILLHYVHPCLVCYSGLILALPDLVVDLDLVAAYQIMCFEQLAVALDLCFPNLLLGHLWRTEKMPFLVQNMYMSCVFGFVIRGETAPLGS